MSALQTKGLTSDTARERVRECVYIVHLLTRALLSVQQFVPPNPVLQMLTNVSVTHLFRLTLNRVYRIYSYIFTCKVCCLPYEMLVYNTFFIDGRNLRVFEG